MGQRTKVGQNSYFGIYAYRIQNHKEIKRKVLQNAQFILEDISKYNKGLDINRKLKDIAVRIQKRINRADLSEDNLRQYKGELSQILGDKYNDVSSDLKEFIKYCIFLSKHDTESMTVINWFNFNDLAFINKTNSIKILTETDCQMATRSDVEIKWVFEGNNAIKGVLSMIDNAFV